MSPPVWLPKRAVAGRRLFLGFGQAELAPLIDGFAARLLGPPGVERLHDVLVQPLHRTGLGRFEGGVFHGGSLVDRLRLRRGSGAGRTTHNGPGPGPGAPEDRLPRAWFGGYLFDHWGHFLLEGLARMLGPEMRASAEPILFLHPGRVGSLLPWMVAAFMELEINPARVVLCHRPTSVGELLVQEPSFIIRAAIRPAAYAGLSRPAAAGGGGTLYLSRAGLVGRRAIEGEVALEQDLARDRGVTIIRPETLPLPEQIAWLARADRILGCEGSAFHSLLFLARAPRAVMLCGAPPNLNYLLADEAVAGDVAYVQAGTGQGGRGGWQLDPSSARERLEEAQAMLDG